MTFVDQTHMDNFSSLALPETANQTYMDFTQTDTHFPTYLLNLKGM